MTTFKYALSICGLSQQEAAEFFGVALPTVKDWSRGSSRPPEGVWRMLASLFGQIQDAADGAADVMQLDGIDPRAWVNLDADLNHDALPVSGALKAAGAMALLMAVADRDS